MIKTPIVKYPLFDKNEKTCRRRHLSDTKYYITIHHVQGESQSNESKRMSREL